MSKKKTKIVNSETKCRYNPFTRVYKCENYLKIYFKKMLSVNSFPLLIQFMTSQRSFASLNFNKFHAIIYTNKQSAQSV